MKNRYCVLVALAVVVALLAVSSCLPSESESDAAINAGKDISNGTATATITADDPPATTSTVVYRLTANTGYILPDTVTVSNSSNYTTFTYTGANNSTGTVTVVGVVGDITLKATCTKVYSVKITYSWGGSSDTDTEYVESGQALSYKFPSKTGYDYPSKIVVSGMSSTYTYDSSKGTVSIKSSNMKDGISITGTYVPKTYTVSYDIDNGSAKVTGTPSVPTYDMSFTVQLVPNLGYETPDADSVVVRMGSVQIAKTAYTYKASDGTLKINKVSGNLAIEASCDEGLFKISYLEPNGLPLIGLEPTSYTFKQGATLPTDAFKDKYEFRGWFENSSLSGPKITEIDKSTYGDKTFYANFMPEKSEELKNSVITTEYIIIGITAVILFGLMIYTRR